MRVQPVKVTKVFSLKRSDEGDSSGCKRRSDCIKEDPCGYVISVKTFLVSVCSQSSHVSSFIGIMWMKIQNKTISQGIL